MVDQLLLNDTLQKINASLNKRFEKDANLYISKQDEYEIKRNLCNEAYGGVVDMARAKGVSHDIIVKVIMRNAGVLNVKDINKFEKGLKPILVDADYRSLVYMMEDVLNSNVYMQRKVRHVLFSYYLKGISSVMRIDYWERGNSVFDLYERAELFTQILEKTKYEDPSGTLKFKLDFARDAFVRFPSIMKDKNVFCKLKNTLDDNGQKEFFKYLCKEMESPSIDSHAYDFILVDAYASYGEMAFDDAVNQIKSSSPSNFKQYIKVICKLFWKEKDKDVLLKMFDTMQRVFHSPYIKSHIKREINTKVWKATTENKILYQQQKAEIDSLMLEVDRPDKKKYSSFTDVSKEIKENTQPKSIAFFWLNLQSPAFEESIKESFTGLSMGYLMPMNETYSWLFNHSQRKGGVKELNKMCERLALPLYEFGEKNQNSLFYDALDQLWLENVVRFKLQGPGIETYMFEKHFDKVKEWR